MNIIRVKRKFIFPVVLLLFLYIAAESFCFLGLFLLERTKNIKYNPVISSLSEKQIKTIKHFLSKSSKGYSTHHPVLGWSLRKNGVSHNGLYKSNSQGIRSEKEYQLMPPENVTRISAFGDSFTHGDDVSNDDTWEEQLSTINPNLEVLNFGVFAYGLDQAYLRYIEDGNSYNPDIVFIGFMSENIYRNVNIFRSFYSYRYENMFFTKPRFNVKRGELVLYKNPLSKLEDYEFFLKNDKMILKQIGSNDYHYQLGYKEGFYDFLPSVKIAKIMNYYFKKKYSRHAIEINNAYNITSDAYKITIKLFDEFYRRALSNDSLPIIILFPNKDDVNEYRQSVRVKYDPLIEYFQANNYDYIDLMGAFESNKQAYDLKELISRKWSHYSPLGNKITAEYILDFLGKNDLMSHEKVKLAIRRKHDLINKVSDK